ncbi:MAG: ATP-dependent helicase C-terminal domain-containing protein [Acidimicrobiales bacterium]
MLGRLDEWLDLGRCRSVADLRRLDATEAVLNLLPWEQRRRLDELAPPTLDPPKVDPNPFATESGRPVWSVRLQHLFGLDEHHDRRTTPDPAHDRAPLPRQPPDADHHRPARLLAWLVPGRPSRSPRPLPQTPLARRPLAP